MKKYTISLQRVERAGFIDFGFGNEDKTGGVIFRNRGNTNLEINGILLQPGEVLNLMDVCNAGEIDATRYFVTFVQNLPNAYLPDVELVQFPDVNLLECILKIYENV